MFRKFVLIGCVAFTSLVSARAEAFVFITEILADPPAGLAGDANGDGVTSSTSDEFIELWNSSDALVDLSGWSLNDALSARHVFASSTLLDAKKFLVVFGGGTSPLDIFWQPASTGTLSLNNTGDTVTLYDAARQLVDQVTYGAEGGQDQALVRLPDGSWARSSQSSPGYFPDAPLEESAAVPEHNTLLYISFGLCALILLNPIAYARLRLGQ